MLVRKLRIDKGWSQETLAEISNLSVRTIQRIERGGNASLESLSALAAVLEVDVSTLVAEAKMDARSEMSQEEREAVAYVRDIKGFYSHLTSYVVVILGLAAINLFTGSGYPWFLWPALGWGIGVVSHGLTVFEVFSFFGVEWEKRQIKKRMERLGN